MTRINLVPPSELHAKHLVAELHEITRVPTLARKAQSCMSKKSIPAAYTLGTGHVLFFYQRLGFIADRYEALCAEMERRHFKCNRIPRAELLSGIDAGLHGTYEPTPEALAINRERIQLRMPR